MTEALRLLLSVIRAPRDVKFTLHNGDCLDVLRTMPENSVDSIVTDPPYGLSFMGKKWDYDVPSEAIWSECLRVLKPGGRVAFATWPPEHFIGRMFAFVGRNAPPPPPGAGAIPPLRAASSSAGVSSRPSSLPISFLMYLLSLVSSHLLMAASLAPAKTLGMRTTVAMISYLHERWPWCA